jgi:hypothetical protein
MTSVYWNVIIRHLRGETEEGEEISLRIVDNSAKIQMGASRILI